MKKPFWLARIGVLALAISLFAACSDSTGPTSGDLDPATAATALDQANSKFFQGNEAVQSLEYFGDFMTGALGADVTALELMPFARADGLGDFARAVHFSVAEAAAAGPERIPVGALGKTFVYNPTTQQYEIDASRTDAPQFGVRFILYAVDPILGAPVVQTDGTLVEVGFIDIIDTSSFPTINIGMEAVIGANKLIDVDVSGTLTQTTLDLDFSGSLSNGSEQLGFTLTVDATETSFQTAFDFSVSGINVTLTLSGDLETTGSITFEVSNGGDDIVVSLVVANGVILEGSGVRLGGKQVAIISGNIEDPVVTNGNGDPLTEQEIAALQDLVAGLEDIFDFFLGMVNFALFLILLGLI